MSSPMDCHPLESSARRLAQVWVSILVIGAVVLLVTVPLAAPLCGWPAWRLARLLKKS